MILEDWIWGPYSFLLYKQISDHCLRTGFAEDGQPSLATWKVDSALGLGELA